MQQFVGYKTGKDDDCADIQYSVNPGFGCPGFYGYGWCHHGWSHHHGSHHGSHRDGEGIADMFPYRSNILTGGNAFKVRSIK